MTLEWIFLFAAGLLGGVLNAVAGGGSFITFPALLFVGINPISANATNTFAACAGYMSGAYAFREDILKHKKALPQLVLVSLIGGVMGAWLLLRVPASLFQEAIPWLLLLATVLFIFGERLNLFLKNMTAHHRHASLISYWLLLVALLGVGIYGGFFNAGLGIIILSYLALAGHTDINAMNGLKLLISTVVSLVAIMLFLYHGVIAWYEGMVVLIGTLVGGYLAAHLSKKLSQQYIRAFVIVVSCGMTAYFFVAVYAN